MRCQPDNEMLSFSRWTTLLHKVTEKHFVIKKKCFFRQRHVAETQDDVNNWKIEDSPFPAPTGMNSRETCGIKSSTGSDTVSAYSVRPDSGLFSTPGTHPFKASDVSRLSEISGKPFTKKWNKDWGPIPRLVGDCLLNEQRSVVFPSSILVTESKQELRSHHGKQEGNLFQSASGERFHNPSGSTERERAIPARVQPHVTSYAEQQKKEWCRKIEFGKMARSHLISSCERTSLKSEVSHSSSFPKAALELIGEIENAGWFEARSSTDLIHGKSFPAIRSPWPHDCWSTQKGYHQVTSKDKLS